MCEWYVKHGPLHLKVQTAPLKTDNPFTLCARSRFSSTCLTTAGSCDEPAGATGRNGLKKDGDSDVRHGGKKLTPVPLSLQPVAGPAAPAAAPEQRRHGRPHACRPALLANIGSPEPPAGAVPRHLPLACTRTHSATLPGSQLKDSTAREGAAGVWPAYKSMPTC